MGVIPRPRTRLLTVVAQDPSITYNGKILTTQVSVPAEELAAGPWGYRVQVIDYDASADTFFKPLSAKKYADLSGDPFENPSDAMILRNPQFHCQNVYALVMRTLARFEHALGRRVSWGFYGHHLKVAPHAFADANAFYSEDDHGLMFGYFPSERHESGKRRRKQRTVFTCLSHDVVVHETTHALLDGLRDRFTLPSSLDQAAFHEGFADIVALLSVFSLEGVTRLVIDYATRSSRSAVIARSSVTAASLRRSVLMGLARQLGQELAVIRGDALRRSVSLKPTRNYYLEDPDFIEPHRRGEILVAAIMNAFLEIWVRRLKGLGEVRKGKLNRDRVVEEGAEIADHLLTIAIRALDYTPPLDITFGDYLSALLTADRELYPDDTRYEFRDNLLESFQSYGITLPEGVKGDGTWNLAPEGLHYDRTHFESMKRDPDEVFRFIWENRKALGICDDAYSKVISVRPCIRIGPDGFMLHETVAECIQILRLRASELKTYKIPRPYTMKSSDEITLYGGAALIFDEYGNLKYHVHKRLCDAQRQTELLYTMWNREGSLTRASKDFAGIHRNRAVHTMKTRDEEW